MNREDVFALCASLAGAVEDYPFGDDVAVFKVGGRMFALITLTEDPGRVNLKCDPAAALEWRALYPAVRAGYHANKKHWNTLELDGTIDSRDIKEMITHSYQLVRTGLPRRQQGQIASR